MKTITQTIDRQKAQEEKWLTALQPLNGLQLNEIIKRWQCCMAEAQRRLQALRIVGKIFYDGGNNRWGGRWHETEE